MDYRESLKSLNGEDYPKPAKKRVFIVGTV
jgi:hypothetical protein